MNQFPMPNMSLVPYVALPAGCTQPSRHMEQPPAGKTSGVFLRIQRVIRNTYNKTGESYGQILILKIKI